MFQSICSANSHNVGCAEVTRENSMVFLFSFYSHGQAAGLHFSRTLILAGCLFQQNPNSAEFSFQQSSHFNRMPFQQNPHFSRTLISAGCLFSRNLISAELSFQQNPHFSRTLISAGGPEVMVLRGFHRFQ